MMQRRAHIPTPEPPQPGEVPPAPADTPPPVSDPVTPVQTPPVREPGPDETPNPKRY